MEDFRIVDNVISSPLCTAARRGETEAVRDLLIKGHSVNLNDNRGWTPLHEAVAHGHIDCVKLLLEHDECNENACTYDGMSPLFVACKYQDNVQLIQVLIENGVSCNLGNTENITPLHVACKSFKLDIAKELIKNGADVDAQDFNKYTPIMDTIEQASGMPKGVRNAQLTIVKFLLDSGANVTKTDLFGRTPMYIAVCEGWLECVELLLDYGSAIDSRTNDGDSALLVAAQSGCVPLVKTLLDRGAETGIVGLSGATALHHALHNGYASIAEELIKKMNIEDLVGKNNKLESFLIYAIDSGCFESFKLVLDNKIYSYLDKAPFCTIERTTMVDDTFFYHYLHQSPLSFLLSNHMDVPHSVPMVKIMLDSGDFELNPRDENYLPPLVALLTGSYGKTDSKHIRQVKRECFFKLLENGADIDYSSLKNFPGIEHIPDIVLAVIAPVKCPVEESLIVTVLAHCFSCDWNDVLNWLLKHHTCSAVVLGTLVKLGTLSKYTLLQMWETVEKCQCNICEKEFANILNIIHEKDCTLQALCRMRIRDWLWQKSRKSSIAEEILNKMVIPSILKQYIVPEKS